MSKFRNLPFFSRFLLLNLVVNAYALTGKIPAFFQFFGKVFTEESKRKAYKDYEPSERDIFAAVYPKSGTNWIMQTLQQIICRGEVEYEHIHDIVAWPESPFPAVSLNAKPPANAYRQMRVIKYNGKAAEFILNEKAYYVTIIRDPKEVVVSAYYFLPSLFGVQDKITIDEWLDIFCSPNFPAGSWASHTASWWALRDKPNVLVFLFDEMKKEPKKCVEKICDMIGIELSNAEQKKVLSKISFDYMRERENQFAPPILPLMRNKTIPQMIRKGKTGNSKELLTQELQARIDEYVLKELGKLGSDFPYREVFTVIE